MGGVIGRTVRRTVRRTSQRALRSSRRVSILAILVLTATVTSGCEYLLYGSPLYPVPSIDPEASFDPYEFTKPLATYTSGSATLAIDGGTPITLSTLKAGPHLFEYYGADVVWTDSDGWYLHVTASEPGGLDSYGSVILDRVSGNRHWTVFDAFGKCKVDVTSGPDADGITGTADCSNLRWSDAVATSTLTLAPSYVEGEDPFDVLVTFEAKR